MLRDLGTAELGIRRFQKDLFHSVKLTGAPAVQLFFCLTMSDVPSDLLLRTRTH